ncbi:hypothetical protein FQN54_005198 [Arachnomyces sp. PD_36]|nr:hypothetical protein FQN54_005198 [Arachnomyces sp. PD_36]
MYFSLTSRFLLVFCLCAISHLSETFEIKPAPGSNPHHRISWRSIASEVKPKSDSTHTSPTSSPLVTLFPPLQSGNHGLRLAKANNGQDSDKKSFSTGEQAAPYQGQRVGNDVLRLPKSPKLGVDLTDTVAENEHDQKANDKGKREDKKGDSKGNNGSGKDGKGNNQGSKPDKPEENDSPLDDVVCSADNVSKRRSISLAEHIQREFSSFFPGVNVSDIIDKRTLPSAPDDKEEYLNWLFRHIRHGDDAHLLPYVRKNGKGKSSHQIHHFLETPFSAGLDGLEGCTGIVVISRYAVYIAHFWDVPSFREKKFDDKGVPIGMPFNEANFQNDVLGYLRDTLNAPEFTNSDSQFPDPSPTAIMIAPQKKRHGAEDERVFKYDEAEKILSDIDQQIKSILGTTEDVNRVGYLVPFRHEKENDIKGGYNHEIGKILVMYDPNNNNADGDCKLRAAAIWSGDSTTQRRDPVYSTEWLKPTATGGFDAFPTVRGVKDEEGNLFKR